MKIKTIIGLAAAAAVALTPVGLALTGGSAAGAAPLPHTTTKVLRPVHANGTPVAGYKVYTERIEDFTCDGASSVGVNANIFECGPSAAGTVACWKSTKHTVLCMQNPFAKSLVRITYAGTLHHANAPKTPVPVALMLFGGQRCSIRDGGAWASVNGHPSWYGAYSCAKGQLYGPEAFQGIDTSVNPWRVHMLTYYKNGKQHIVDYRVEHSYFAGTAS